MLNHTEHIVQEIKLEEMLKIWREICLDSRLFYSYLLGNAKIQKI